MRARLLVRVLSWFILAIALFSAWYVVAADYGYGMVSGTYRYRQGEETSTLILKKDGTFVQERIRKDKIEHAQGAWYRIGEGGIHFSKEFLPVDDVNSESDGTTYGEVQKSFLELIPSIVLGPDREHGPRFHRELLR